MELEGLAGRVAVVTGGARGIGRCVVERLLASGAKTAALDLEPAPLDGALPVQVDVADEDSVDQAFTHVERELGTPELVVLNAGIIMKAPIEEHTLADWERMLAVNLTGPFLCARRALGGMRRAGYGRLVIVGSSAGINGIGAAPPAVPGYAASKGGAMALAKSIALEYAEHGVTANAIAPTLIDTGMLRTLQADFRSQIPVGRYGKPEEVADLIIFLCSASAGYITGEVIDINGGYLVD